MIENSFIKLNGNAIHKKRHCANVLDMATKAFDGVFVQDLLGKCYLSIPYEKGHCFTGPVKELDDYRVLGARSEGHVCIALGEKKGKYDYIIISFDDKFGSYEIRKIKDVSYGPVNMTTLPNGVCVFAMESEVQLFKGNSIKVIKDPPFDSTTRLFNVSGDVFYIDGSKVVAAKMKKTP